MPDPFSFRPMQPDDGPALKRLMEYDPPAAGLSMTTRFLVDPYSAWTILQPQMVGVVAETPGGKDIVGAATVSFGQVQCEQQMYPAGFLENLKVHPDYRKRGLGARLAQWRITTARAHFGNDGLIITGTSSDNTASIATMKKWCSQLLTTQLVVPRPVRHTPPEPQPGITIRAAQPHDLAEIATRSRHFFAGYNLYVRRSPEQLATQLHGPAPVYHCRVACDTNGNLMAGVLLVLRSQLMVDEFAHVPLPLRAITRLTHLIPPDYRLRLLEVGDFWFSDRAAARALWDHIRWEFRDQASTVSASYDPRGPLADVLQVKPWHQPRINLVLAVHSPIPLDEARLVCGLLRG